MPGRRGLLSQGRTKGCGLSKLLKLKAWLTVSEAARHLSILFGEDVTEADVLRLALDRVLTLSVNFVNHAYAQRGRIKSASEATYIDFPADPAAAVKAKSPEEYQGGWMKVPKGIRLSDGSVIDLDDRVITLDGVYDLPMIGGERLDVEHRYQLLTGGPAVTLTNIDGAFVSGRDDAIFQLQAHFDDSPHSAARESKKPRCHPDNFYPAGGLPEDAVLVVRTDALAKVQTRLVADEGRRGGSAELSTRERDTLLKLVVGMAIEGYRYDPNAQRNEAPGEIAGDLAKHGIELTDDTVRKWLKEAASTVLPRKRPKA